MPDISVIIPVYNRPDELEGLLISISLQKKKPLEVIVVEDGSTIKSETVCKRFSSKLEIKYLEQDNTGPGPARNFGAKNAKGEWLLFLDSDTELPESYFEEIEGALSQNPDTDLFGGPDSDREDFSTLQKAINYAMTSPLTTGGIRGGKKQADIFYPRSFNMGVKKKFFDKVGGFSSLRFGEDLDLSMRLMKMGASSSLFVDAFVYHKRRTSLKAFFKQVFNSGMARIFLNKRHPGTLKPVHCLPSLFTLYLIFLIFAGWASNLVWYPLLTALLIWFIHSSAVSQSVLIGVVATITSVIQLVGYGTGFLKALVFQSDKEAFDFEKTFYE